MERAIAELLAEALDNIAHALNRQAAAQERSLEIAEGGLVLQQQMASSSKALEEMLKANS